MHKTARLQIALGATMIFLYALAWGTLMDPLVGYSAVALIAIITVVLATRRWWIPRLPTKHQARLWWRDHWKHFLVVIPLGLAGFLAWRFWPWGLVGAAVILFLTVTKVVSWQRVRRGYGGMEFPGETVLRAERHHWVAFFVFGWEWGQQEWEGPERGKEERWLGWLLKTIISLLWRGFQDRKLWPIGYLIVTAAAIFLETQKHFAPEFDWWVYPVLGVVWVAGSNISAIHWWDFWTFVWPGHYSVLTDQNITMVRPTKGPVGTVEPDSATVPLRNIGHWGTRRRALGGGDWDPAFVFGKEPVIFRFLKDPEDFSRAAREQAEKLKAQQQRQRR